MTQQPPPGGVPPPMASDQQYQQWLMMQQQAQPQVPPSAGWAAPAQQQPQGSQYAAGAGSDEVKSLWIGDLQNWMDENYLYNCFVAMAGETVTVKLIRNKQTNFLEGYGFIEFTTRAAAERVLQTYNGTPMQGCEQTFRLNWATLGAGERRQDDGSDFTIFVGDLAADVTDYMLQETFRAVYPSIKGAKVVTDRTTGRSKGYGFVRFADETEQMRAMTEMNGMYCSTRPMRIGPAATKKPVIGQQFQKRHQQALILGALELISAEMIPLLCVASF